MDEPWRVDIILRFINNTEILGVLDSRNLVRPDSVVDAGSMIVSSSDSEDDSGSEATLDMDQD